MESSRARSEVTRRWHRTVWRLMRANLSIPGLIIGGLLFSAALTPSLLPRGVEVQGILSGCAFVFGYAIGAVLQWLWAYLGFGMPTGRMRLWLGLALTAIVAAIAAVSLYWTTAWQDEIRTLMGAPPVEVGHPLRVLLIALLPALILIPIGTLLVRGVQWVAHLLHPLMPPRVAFVASLVVVGTLMATLGNGVLLRGALRAADSFFERLDSLAGQFGTPPANPLLSGSSASLVAWDTIGRDGRVYVATGPSREKIAETIGRPAIEPLRVYVGLRSAETLEARARLALDEMLRVGAFERTILVVIMPVGTGWVDPPGIDALEYLMAGDVASVALQYSYLTSALSLVVEPDYGTAAAQALFKVVYDHWTAMPRDRRPRLYLNGLSLGAHASQASTQIFDVLADPFDGALWVGPPFTSAIWRWATANRQPDTPQWLPRFGNQTVIRFTDDGSGLTVADVPWGPMRMAFLQHASDPIVFFEWSSLYTPPAWLAAPRGADVSPGLTWYPVVTWLQVGMDMALSQTSPPGHGHVYAMNEYLDAWLALVEPPGWDATSIGALKAKLVGK